MTATERPATRPQNPFFSSGPCAKRPGWSLDNLKNATARPFAPLGCRQGQAEACHRQNPRTAQAAGRLSCRRRSGLGYRRGGDGALVAARPARCRHLGLGGLRQELGRRCRQAVEARRRPRHGGRPTVNCPIFARSISLAMSSLPGTGPHRACGCRTQTGSRRTGRASPFATRLLAFSRKASIGRSSM